MVSFGPGMANPQKPHSERSIACQPWAKIGLSHSESNHLGNRLAEVALLHFDAAARPKTRRIPNSTPKMLCDLTASH